VQLSAAARTKRCVWRPRSAPVGRAGDYGRGMDAPRTIAAEVDAQQRAESEAADDPVHIAQAEARVEVRENKGERQQRSSNLLRARTDR
jgi:hypothetical protein